MEQLPAELIEKISGDSGLRIRDVVNLSLTSRRLYDTIRNNNRIWKTKFYQLYPQLKNKLDHNPEFYYTELACLYMLKQVMLMKLEGMCETFYKTLELSNGDLMDWHSLVASNWNNYFYVVEDLLEMIHGGCAACLLNPIDTDEVIPFKTPGHMTKKYYAVKVLRRVRQVYLTKLWFEYIKKPPEECLLEEGATMMAQWFQCTKVIELEQISKTLDQITEMVKELIKISFPNSPLLRVSDEQLKGWKFAKKPDNNWTLEERCEIFHIIGQVLFYHLNFQIYDNPDNSDYGEFFINKALETKRAKLPMMAIIYESVARRLGVRCEISINMSQFLLRFCATVDPIPVYYYINLSDKGSISKASFCPFQRRNTNTPAIPAASAELVITYLVNDLRECAISPTFDYVILRCILELLQVISPKDTGIRNDLAALYLRLNFGNFDLPNGADGLISYHHPDITDKSMEPVRRPPNDYVKFAVGMVMKHKRLSYKCVIFNWDKECVASPEWIANNQLPNLKYGHKQPFYNVLVEDYSHRYVAQENLIPSDDPASIRPNDEYGRYFSHFYQAYFVPNAVTHRLFPQDGEIRKKYHDMLCHKSFSGFYDALAPPAPVPAPEVPFEF